MDDLEILKMNVLENRCPFFSDEELLYYLQKNDNDIDKASYECLIIKAETTGLNVSGITTADTSAYFRRMASRYVKTNTGILL